MPSVFIFPPLRRISRMVAILGLGGLAWNAGAQNLADGIAQGNDPGPAAASPFNRDSERLEKALQSLSWEQFRSVVMAIPKLKADVEAYGPLGWQYVQANYRTYPWKKNIDKLQDLQKKRLSELIDEVRAGAKPSN